MTVKYFLIIMFTTRFRGMEKEACSMLYFLNPSVLTFW